MTVPGVWDGQSPEDWLTKEGGPARQALADFSRGNLTLVTTWHPGGGGTRVFSYSCAGAKNHAGVTLLRLGSLGLIEPVFPECSEFALTDLGKAYVAQHKIGVA